MKHPPKQTLAVLTLALATLVASLATSIANIALPAIGESYALPLKQTQWVIQSYLISTTLGVLIAGSLGDRWGRWRVLRGSLLLFSLGAAVAATAPNFVLLILARALQGLAAAGLISLSLACARDLSETRTGRLIGLMGSLSALGTALGPALGGSLVASTGWRSTFALLMGIGVLGVVISLVYRAADEASQHHHSAQRSFGDSGLGLIALLSLVVGLICLPALYGLLLVIAGVLTGLIAYHRNRADLIGLPPSGLVANLMVAATMMSTLILTPFYLTDGLGLSLQRTGVLMTLGPVISVFAGMISGAMTDRFQAIPMRTAGLGLMVVGCVLLGVLSAQVGVLGYVLGIVVLTPGYQLFQAANSTLLISQSDAARRGQTSAWLGLSRNLGLISGAALSALIYEFVAATPTAAFSKMFALAAIGLLLTVWLTRR